ncbi:MAG: Gldg family protein [Methylohalobius sp.]|nr:Gldg family protein [Methylohalobius sp.]
MRVVWTVLRREFSAYFATPLAYLFLFIFQALSGISTFLVGGFYERGQADLTPFFDYHPWLYLFLAPSVSMRLWAEERRIGTHELVLTLPLSLGQAILGKFLAAWLFVGLALTFTFPLWVTVNWLGDPDNGAILAAYFGSWLLAGVYLALGEAISATTSSQTVAFIATAAISFLLTAAGTPAILQMFLPWAPAKLIDHIAELSLPWHFQTLARGTIELQNLAFFILMIGGWLGVCAYFVSAAQHRRRPIWLGAALICLAGALGSAWLPSLRLDLTAGQLYTLSPGTRQLLSSLSQPITLEFYFSDRASRELPGVRAYARRVLDLLKEYQGASNRVHLLRIEVEPFSTTEDQAASRGLRSVRLAPDAPEIYFGLAAVASSGQTAIIPFFNQERERYLEYDLSELIAQVSRSRPPRIALYAEPDLLARGGVNPWNQAAQEPWASLEQVARFYALTWLDKNFRSIPRDADLLVLVHPKELSEISLYAIDQFVLSGKPALIFVDPYAELDGPPRFIAPMRSKSSDLNRLFRAWGFECDNVHFIADEAYATPVTVAQGRPPSRHLGLLSLDHNALGDEAMLASLNRLVLSSAGAVRPLIREVRFIPLMRSSPQAMAMPTVALDYLFDPAILYEAFRPQGQRFTLAAMIEGQKTPSAFPDGPPPGADLAPHLSQAQGLIRLLVVGDSDILTDRLWAKIETGPDGERTVVPMSDNSAFLLSAIDYLTGHPDLISIRSRGRYLRPFTRVEALRRQAEQSLRERLEALREQLAATERALQDAKNPNIYRERLRLQAELRQLTYQFNQEVEALGNRLKLINILLAPLSLTLLAYAAALSLRALAKRRPL